VGAAFQGRGRIGPGQRQGIGESRAGSVRRHGRPGAVVGGGA